MTDLTLKECDELMTDIVKAAHKMVLDDLNKMSLDIVLDYTHRGMILDINDGHIVDYRERG